MQLCTQCYSNFYNKYLGAFDLYFKYVCLQLGVKEKWIIWILYGYDHQNILLLSYSVFGLIHMFYTRISITVIRFTVGVKINDLYEQIVFIKKKKISANSKLDVWFI